MTTKTPPVHQHSAGQTPQWKYRRRTQHLLGRLRFCVSVGGEFDARSDRSHKESRLSNGEIERPNCNSGI